MARDSEQTKKKILDALAHILAESGFEGVGINAVARRAGVDKVLIYRYFGGMDQLLKAYAREGGFWPDWEELTGLEPEEMGRTGLREMTRSIMTGHLDQLRSRPLTQEIMRWELTARNELTDQLARSREETTGLLMEMMGRSQEEPGMARMLAAGAVIHAGITYLVLRSATADVYMGVDLTTEAGWRRIRSAVEEIMDAYWDKIEGEPPQKEKEDEP